MKIVILGCGRTGAALATSLARKGHDVCIIDNRSEAFARLGIDFRGRTVQGEGMDYEVLRQADIAAADAFVACTNGDNRNLTASQIAREVFAVPKVVARVNDPLRGEIFAELGLLTISPTTLGSDLIYNAILSGSPVSLLC